MLTDSIIQKAKPRAKQYRLSDGKGLSLLVYPTGGKTWRYRYSFEGKESMISLGAYPDISLDEARKRLEECRTTKATGTNPSKKKQALKQELINNQENTFEKIAREWHGKKKLKWDEKYARAVLRRLELNLFPSLGSRPIRDIKPLELLGVLRKVEERGALDVAKRCLQRAGEIFRYAVITGKAEHDIAADIKGALEASPPTKHRNNIKPHELPEFMKSLEQYDGHPSTKLALRFLLLTFVRTNELRGARWDEIHWEAKQWRIPKERMKMKEEHIVPLSHQTIDVLNNIKKISGHTPFLFPGVNNPKSVMSENTMLYAIYRMGYHSKATGHGFRATASTALNEMGFNSKHIEVQLSHAERNQVKRAYDHALYLPEREHMMQHWANFLDEVSREGSKVTTKDFRVKFWLQTTPS
jgi:integrase